MSVRSTMSDYQVYYDDQCEICQAGVAWLKILDRHCRVEPLPIRAELVPAGTTLSDCLEDLHVVGPDGNITRGWRAVATLAQLSPWTRLIGTAGKLPGLYWIGDRAYRWLARNRYALSRCRGGACQSSRPDLVRRAADWKAFWACRATGGVLHLPLAMAAYARRLSENLSTHVQYRRRKVVLLDGRLSLCFLGGGPSDLIPILFGEQFLMIVYDGVAVDPGSSNMRGSLRRHIGNLKSPLAAIVATHHHEEHIGNLDWLARATGAPVFLTKETLQLIYRFGKLPLARRWIIGQPSPLNIEVHELGDSLRTHHGSVRVVSTPGHSSDHVSLYDPEHKLLLAGDAFMGSYFATPNPDVDSERWIASLESLLSMPIEILVEGHGHVYSLRQDIPDLPGLVIRQAPHEALKKRLEFFRWLRKQIEAGAKDGWSPRAVEATCFPWGQRWAWENFLNDTVIRLLSVGHFSRSELIRSFNREPSPETPLPHVFEARLHQ